MWRKQDESKTPSPSQEVKAAIPVEPPIPPAAPVLAQSASPRQATAPAGHLTSSLTIKGEITGRDDLFIDGEVQGKIRLEDGRVTIGPQGRITGDVHAREIVVRGKVRGNLSGHDRVQVGPSGHATGDIVTRLISIEEGAEVRGKVEIVRSEETRGSRVNLSGADGEVSVPVGLHAKEASSSL